MEHKKREGGPGGDAAAKKLQIEIRERVLSQMDMTQELTDEEVTGLIERCILEASQDCFISLSQKRRLAKDIFLAIRKLDFLQELIDDESVTEIMVN